MNETEDNSDDYYDDLSGELMRLFNQSTNGTENISLPPMIIVESFYDDLPAFLPKLFIAIQILIFVTGLIGNLIACFVMSCSKAMRTTTNMYLLNLSISDVLYLISTMPSEIYEYFNNEMFYVDSSIICFIKNWIGEASVNSSILTITALTIERYMAICHPFTSRAMSQKSRIRKFIIFIWLISATCAAILVSTSRIVRDFGQVVCYFNALPYSIQVMTLLFFIFPMAVISILYALIAKILMSRKEIASQTDKNSRKTVKMLVLIVIAFFLCWSPFQAQRLIVLYFPDVDDEYRDTYNAIYRYLSIVARVLCSLPTAVDPIIYTFMTKNFGQAFKGLLSKSSVLKSRSTSTRVQDSSFYTPQCPENV